MWPAIIGAAASLGSTFLGHSSASQANAQNIKMQREQRAWEEKMSDSAVRRRAEDIRLAGGNPALAFTGGQSASTPSVAAPTVEPTFRPEWVKGEFGTAAMLSGQLDQLKAQTQNISADTRKKVIEADIMEDITGPSSAADLVRKRQDNEKFQFEMDKAIADAEISQTTAKILREKGPAMLRMLQTQIDMGQLDLSSARKMVEMFGITGRDSGTAAGILQSGLSTLGRGAKAVANLFKKEKVLPPIRTTTETIKSKGRTTTTSTRNR